MSSDAPDARTIKQILFDMDGGVNDLVSWSVLLRDLGASSGDIDPRGVFVMAAAMLETAEAVKADWERAFDLARPMQEGA